MSLYLKICGIRDEAGAEAAVSAGADAVGFVFADSVRRVTPRQATDIASTIPSSVEKVAVFLRPSLREIADVLDVFDADRVQADLESLTVFEGRPVMPVVRDHVTGRSGRRILFEGRRSGVGETADWTVAAALAASTDLVLAGGLHGDNVISAITEVKPFGVDVSSGVESSRGVKDPGLIEKFVNRVRSMENEEVSR